jgi:hypothetical protein
MAIRAKELPFRALGVAESGVQRDRNGKVERAAGGPRRGAPDEDGVSARVGARRRRMGARHLEGGKGRGRERGHRGDERDERAAGSCEHPDDDKGARGR